MASVKSNKLGQLFLKKKLITEEQLVEAMQHQAVSNQFLGSILLDKGWVSQEQLLQVLSDQYQLPYVLLRRQAIDKKVIDILPLKIALHYKVMPVELNNSTLKVAISNPQDVHLVDELRAALQERYMIEPVLASDNDINFTIQKYYGVGAETITDLVSEQDKSIKRDSVDDMAIENIEQLASDASVVKLVNQVILEAHHRRATDIHIEPYRGQVRLRYRIDGVLRAVDVPSAIRQLFPAIISRVKVLSNLNIVERRLPQDGRASVMVGDEKLDLRVSILPTPAGESVVVRILPSRMLLELKGLGFRQKDYDYLINLIKRPHGLIFVTGPTGSGKTTSLYGMLNTINTDERKIITVEDPVEYEIAGVTQVQINSAIGLSFATGLRSMLRHDPDVMMVGEVRDLETAELAIRIALTGHLVFSTLHTNDAASGITRLLDMGIDPYLIASSVECFMAQRLIRLLCSTCKVEVKPDRKDLSKMYQAKGCDECQHTGYLGRSAIYEILPVTQPIRDLILSRASADAIWRKAIEGGLQTMQQGGMEIVQQGMTTPDEVLRVSQEDEILRVTKVGE